MSMRFWGLAGAVLLAGAFLLSCGSSGHTGFVYLASQGAQSVSAYSLNLNSGVLNSSNGGLIANGKSVPTGVQPTAMILNPAQTVGFVADYGSNDIVRFSINKDGTLGTLGNTALKGPASHPVALAMDPGGKFLFVVDQGDPNHAAACTIQDPVYPANCSARVSVFTADSQGGVSEVPNSPFPLLTLREAATFSAAISPTALAVSNQGNFLYVTEQNNNILVGFAFDGSSGALSELTSTPIVVGVAPSAVHSPASGNFLYVANAQSNDISEFTIDGTTGVLTPVAGSPVASGVGPIGFTSILTSANANTTYVYVINGQGSSISSYTLNQVTGVLKPLNPATVSTGSIPVAATIRSNGQVAGNYWMLVSDNGGNAVTTFELTTSTGGLAALPQLVSPVAPFGIASR